MRSVGVCQAFHTVTPDRECNTLALPTNTRRAATILCHFFLHRTTTIAPWARLRRELRSLASPVMTYASELRDSCSPTLLTECLWNTPCMFFSCMQATFGPFGKPYQQGPDSCLYRNSWRSKMHGAVYGCS